MTVPVFTPNLRDVGNLSTLDGRVLSAGRVLRSAVPHGGDSGPDGVPWPPALVIDLRSATELEPVHPLASAGAQIVNLPLLAALRPGAAMPQTLPDLYQLMLDVAAANLVELVRLVGQAQGATLIHCAAGKDRTGVSIALLLRLAGVSRDIVLEDYLLTNAALPDIDARLRPATPAGKGVTAAANGHVYPPGYAHVLPEALNGVLDVWDDHDGGVNGWFGAAGGDSSDVEALRRTLLV